MGQVSCGYDFNPDYSATICQYDAPYIIHGCILEWRQLYWHSKTGGKLIHPVKGRLLLTRWKKSIV
jgi:hypothetical protein